jgi:hypothetical protein
MTSAAALAVAIADGLHRADVLGDRPIARGERLSLATGLPGIALLHIELAAAGLRPWRTAQALLRVIADGDITGGPDSHLFYGAPAVAHALACAAAVRPGSYQHALDRLESAIVTEALRRVDAAQARIDSGRAATLAEFDTIRGLTGLGALLLRHDPTGPALRVVLEYLVRLAEPIETSHGTLPGWWVPTGPSDHRFPAGHVNLGLAHGIAGPLALLGHAGRAGITVPGQRRTIAALLNWFDQQVTKTDSGRPVWPYWITPAGLHAAQPPASGSLRPSWCYGIAGVARAIQVAALAVGDTAHARAVEAVLLHTVSDPEQTSALDSPSLFHGAGGQRLAVPRSIPRPARRSRRTP